MPTNVTCTRVLEWDMGHRVYRHESKCSHPHGHRYRGEFTASSCGLDDVGRIIDFSVLKKLVGGWIDENWDHAFIVYQNDPALALLQQFPETNGAPRVLGVDFNPTAENIVAHLGCVVCPKVLRYTGVVVTHIRLYETPNGYADWDM